MVPEMVYCQVPCHCCGELVSAEKEGELVKVSTCSASKAKCSWLLAVSYEAELSAFVSAAWKGWQASELAKAVAK